jgi:hypothetical protein
VAPLSNGGAREKRLLFVGNIGPGFERFGICPGESDAKKIGPGLKGISKRGTFTVNQNKVTDESLKTWIENGDTLMPPFKEVLEAPQIQDVVAYVKTL